MAENDAVAAELRALTGQLQRNERATAAQTAAAAANTGAPSYSGGGGGSGAAPSFGAQGNAPAPPRFSNYTERQNFTAILGKVFSGAASMAGAVSMALPTTQEAVDLQALASRMKFYGGSNYNTVGKSMAAQLQASFMGTATGPEDAALASNYAAQRGLLPGLQNFGAGKGYAGIMGGAALASNLTPGLGLTGGVGVMAGLNDPKTVNMARMFGIQMRNGKGTGMMDLPSIINQLYEILSKAGPVTKENIAISVMPGNALDSILNQYFGLDPNIRSTVISGLTQKAAGGDFSQASLRATGGLTAGISSTAYRATSEMNLLQKFSDRTVKNLVGANNILTGIYGGLAPRASGNSAADKLVQGIGNFSTIAETLGGARNGAGQLLIDSMFDMTEGAAKGTYKGLMSGSYMGKAVGLSSLGLGALGAKKTLDYLKGGFNNSNLTSPFSFTGEAGVNPSVAGPTYTGAITINVSGGVDQYNIASAISDALSRAM